MANTLYDYYKTKGQSLPSVQERAKTFESLGLGSSAGYKGTYEQNVSLLSALQKPAVPNPATPTAPPAPAPTPSPAPTAPKTTIDIYGQSVPTQTSLLEQYRKQLGLDKLTEDINTALASQPKKSDIYTKELASLDPQRTQLKSLDQRIAEMENALDASEEDIRKRTTESGGLVTESQTQRLVASEKKPLVDAYNKILGERNRLASSLGEEERLARERAGIAYEDALLPLTTAQAKLSAINPLFEQYFGAAKSDLDLQIKAAETAAEKRNAKVVTTQVDEGGNVSVVTQEADGSFKVNKVGNIGKPQKQSSGTEEAYDDNDIEAYALELLNNPNFDTSNVPQKIRAKVLRKRDAIVAEAENPQPAPGSVSPGPLSAFPNLQGLSFGSSNSTPAFLQPAAGSFSLFK
ncbi:hypothetical protein EPO34_03620 [Patescibacteria group bacterium]|nr:MAG: hypothetical protein EPO34_03620 [Patescibacteria group bacterium]